MVLIPERLGICLLEVSLEDLIANDSLVRQDGLRPS